MGLWCVDLDRRILGYVTPRVCLGGLVQASKPSTDRLHLRDLLAYGRRYHFVGGSPKGFTMETTSRIPWRRRDRTPAVARLSAEFQVLDDNLTQINITARIRIWHLWSGMLVPMFFTPLFLFGIWQPFWVRVLELIALYVLAWSAYRYRAAIDAHDMVYFIEKALEDFLPKSVSELGAHVPHVVDNRQDFPAAWEKFYEQHTDQES